MKRLRRISSKALENTNKIKTDFTKSETYHALHFEEPLWRKQNWLASSRRTPQMVYHIAVIILMVI